MVLAALIIGFVAATLFLDIAVYFLLELFPNLPEIAAKIISFVSIFVIVNILARILGGILNKFITVTFLQPVNRIAGGAFAFLKVALIFSIIILLIDSVPLLSKYIFQSIGSEESVVFKPLKELAPLIYKIFTALIPGHHDVEQKFMDTIQKADSTTQQLLNR
jgi:uncharacterized membrane protein required for colicin V production